MAFLDDLRQYLERGDAPRFSFQPDTAAHRRHLVSRLTSLEKAGRPDAELRKEHDYWTPENVEHFARSMGNALLGDFAQGASPERLRQLIDLAIDRELGLDTSTGSKIQDWQIDDFRSGLAWLGSVQARRNEEIVQYASRIRAVRFADERRSVTPIGKLLLELPDRDAVRWLLAAEVVQSHGVEDEWRLSRLSAAFLLKNPEDYWDLNEHGNPTWAVKWSLLLRLSRMGIVEAKSEPDHSEIHYSLLPNGRPLLEEIASDTETPFTLLVHALLQDETAAAINRVRPVGMAAQAVSSVEATARHARMVAHEIRNALVPVQSAIESLYRDLDRRGAADPVEKRKDTIEGGIQRVFQFLRDISRIADLASAPSDLFDVASAAQDAIAAFAANNGIVVPFSQAGPLPAVKGHRDRFVLALHNILRNAAQARAAEGLRIAVSAGTQNGAEVFLAVDDNGPGVPAEHRSNIFEPGFSLRPDGTGQGLALVREVVEVEMAGRAICEQSDLGGARIVLRLPVGAKRSIS